MVMVPDTSHVSVTCLHMSTRDLLTPGPFELQTSVMGQNGVEFHQKSNGHCPRQVTHVRHVSDVPFLFGTVQCFISVFHQEYKGHDPQHSTHVLNMSTLDLHMIL